MWIEPLQVAGAHSSIYEAYYHQVDPNGSGAIQALDAARFLKKSRLSDVVLSKIWDLSDPTGKGYLDKAGLFVALKLVALAQAGKDINMTNIHSEAPPPKVGELPKVPPPPLAAAPPPALAPLGDWSVKPAERDKYSALFDSLQPSNGLIPGNKVKGVLMESKLPLETLGKIWDLADQDKDGMLDRHEFIVAMHLVYKALEKHAVPTTLPPELRARPARPPSRPASRPPSRPPSPQPRPPPPRPPHSNAMLLDGLLDLSTPQSAQPPSVPGAAPAAGGAPWMSQSDRAQYDAMFEAADLDRDGFVSGAEIRGVFLHSGLPQMTLAQIWSLCDSSGSGKLSAWQFRAAMCLVQRALRGLPPPAALPDHLLDDTPVPQKPEPVSLGPQPTPEMDAIAREVDALARERLALEAELATKQRELNVKTGEADSLQSELDTLTATLKQLESQKGEAQKRLNDLKSQVDKLRSQVSAQEAAVAETEAEACARRAALANRSELERRLRSELTAEEARLSGVEARLQAAVLAASQAGIKLQQLDQQRRSLDDALAAFDAGGPAPDTTLQPLHRPDHLDRLVRGCTPSDAPEEDGFSKSEVTMNGSFANFEEPFAATQDPFAPADTQHTKSFGSFSPGSDPFSGDSFVQSEAPAASDSAWESDPFAVLHAPTRPTGNATGANPASSANPSANPAKRHKTPPPRPAPPRPLPPHKNDRKPALDFTEDPFKDYRYEDPFNIDDPFADFTDPERGRERARPSSAAADAFAPASSALNGRVSAPPLAARDSWAAWPDDSWGPPGPHTDDWAADWATDVNATDTVDANANPESARPSGTLPAKKEKSPRPVKYARSLVHTIGGIGRYRNKDKKAKDRGPGVAPSEEQQWAWAEAESRRLQREADQRRRQEERELQLALALSRRDR